MTPRREVMSQIADRLTAARVDHPMRVGIDGVCGAGKSTFARELVDVLISRGETAIHLDSDGFHQVSAIRRQDGASPARVYYDHAYDFTALAEKVLWPLGPGGSRVYTTKIHDLASDQTINDQTAVAAPDAIVIFDCTFLQRGELRGLWDEVIFLQVARAIGTSRGVARDAGRLGGQDQALAAYESRYMAACDLYVAEEQPALKANIVVDHDDPAFPVVTVGDLAC